MPVPMEHYHFKDQTNCQICVENQKDIIANRFWRIIKNTALIRELNIMVAMIKLFEPIRVKPKSATPEMDGYTIRKEASDSPAGGG